MDKNKKNKDEILLPLIITFVLLLVFFWAFRFVVSLKSTGPIAKEVGVELQDIGGGVVPAQMKLTEKTAAGQSILTQMTKSTPTTAEKNITGFYNLELAPEKTPIKKIEFKDTDVQTIKNLKIEDVGKKDRWEQVYVIDPTGVNFTNATVTVTAVGDELYKCKDWDSELQECSGDWKKVMDIVPGEDYNFILTKEDPAFAEIIRVTKASHLDEKRNFVEDVYWLVKNRDYRYALIPKGDYLRAKFEMPLTNDNDITIYAKSNESGRVEVYEKNSDVKIADFGVISEDKKYQIFLTGLNGSQKTFDLKVVGGDVKFDQIIDPTQVLNFTSTTTWTAPAGITKILVEAWGGGGAGGGRTTNGYAGGGGGGAYARANVTVTPGSNYAVVAAASVAGGTGNGANGNPTYFGNGLTVNASGGSGGLSAGTGGAGGTVAASKGTIRYAGGNGGTQTGAISGGGAGGAGSTGAGGNATGGTAGTGTTLFGGNGGAGRSSVGNGNAGSTYGGGGGGARRTFSGSYAGGAGAAGRLSISIDRTPPTWVQTPTSRVVEFTYPLYYDVNATDPLGISQYRVNDTTRFKINNVTGVLQNNTGLPVRVYWLNISVNDLNNNILSTRINVTVRDTKAPTWIQTPQNKTVEYGIAFYYDLNATDPSGISQYWANDTTTYFKMNKTTGVLQNKTLLPVGIRWVMLYVNDTKNNVLSTKINITTKDTTPPTINSVSSAPNPVGYGKKINFTANVTDKRAVSRVWIDIRGLNRTMTADGTNKWYYDKFNTSTTAGKYNYTVYANDTSNNKATPKKGNFTINAKDTIPPNVTNLLTNGTIHNINSSVLILVSVKDNVGVDTVLANITKPNNSTSLIRLSFNAITARYEKSFNKTQYLGKYIVRIIANDTSGNINGTEKTSFSVVEPKMNIRKYDYPDPVQLSGVLNYSINYTTNKTGGIVLLDFQDFKFVTNSTFPKDSPQLVQSPAGTLIIVYYASPGSNNDIYVVRSTNNGINWSSPIQVTDEVQNDMWPNIFVNSAGKLIIVYSHETSPGYNDIWLVDSSDDGLTWSEPNAVTTTPTISEWEPTIAEDSAGNYYTTYEASEGVNASFTEIYIRNASNYKGTWSNRIAITNNTYMDVDDDVMYKNGTFYFAWAPANPDHQQIWFAKTKTPLVPGILDKNKTQVTANNIYNYETSLNRDTQGNIYIGWVGLLNSSEVGLPNVNRTSNEVFIASSYDNGKTWDVRQVTHNKVSDAYPGIIQTSSGGLYYISALRANKGYLDLTFAQRVFSPEDVINATIKDKIPKRTIVKSIGQGGTQQGDIIMWNFPVLYAGNSGFVSFSVLINKTIANGTKINNTANCTYYDLTHRLIDAINSSANTTVIDSIHPAVTHLLPVGKNFNQSSPVLISANVTDNGIISSVKANMTIPGDGTQVIQLLFNTTTKLYQGVFTNTSKLGIYVFRIIAKDTTGNVNSSMSSYFASVNHPPTTPTSLTCNGGSCNRAFNTTITLVCGGSTDPDNDSITYHIEALYAPLIGDEKVINAQFESGTDGFVYRDDMYGTASSAQAVGKRELSGNCTGGYCLNVELNLNSSKTGSAISGGWNRTFDVNDSPKYVKVAFNYALRIADAADPQDNITIKYRNITSGKVITGAVLKGVLGTDFIDEYSHGAVSYRAYSLFNTTRPFDAGCILSPVDNVNKYGECWIDNVTITEVNTSATLKEWREIGTHKKGGSFVWDISEEKPQSGVNFRCRAIDNGSNIFSNYYTSSGNATIVNILLPKINSLTDAPDPVNFGERNNITANVTTKVGAVSRVWVEISGLNRTMTADGTNKWYYDKFNTSVAAGMYYYVVYANNTMKNNAVPKKGNFTVSALVSISMANAPINFSSVQAGRTVNASTSGWPVWIKNTGNTNISIKMKGRNLTGQTNPSYKINVTRVHWATNKTFTVDNILTGAYVVAKSNLQMGKNVSFYYKLYTPYGVIQQNYRGNVTFLAVQS